MNFSVSTQTCLRRRSEKGRGQCTHGWVWHSDGHTYFFFTGALSNQIHHFQPVSYINISNGVKRFEITVSNGYKTGIT